MTEMKRKEFHVFAGSLYYPTGGLGDYHASFETIEEAREKVNELMKEWNWFEIVRSDEQGLKSFYEGSDDDD